MKYFWSNKDPREVFDRSKGQQIVIVRPESYSERTAFGTIHTKNTWSVFTDFSDYRLIDADMEWDSSWLWIPFERVK